MAHTGAPQSRLRQARNDTCGRNRSAIIAALCFVACGQAARDDDITAVAAPPSARANDVEPTVVSPPADEGVTPPLPPAEPAEPEPALAAAAPTSGADDTESVGVPVDTSEPEPVPSFSVIPPLPHHRALAEQVGAASELHTEIHSISPDGSVAIGVSHVFLRDLGREWSEAFRFTREAGTVSLGRRPGVPEDAEGTVTSISAVSRDGSTVIGMAADVGAELHPFLWTQAAGMVAFDVLPFQPALPSYYASDDGAVIGVGTFGAGGIRTHRWTPANGSRDLGVMPGYQASALVGLDANGTTFYGNGYDADSRVQGFFWTEATGMQGLGYLPGFRGCSLLSNPVSSLSHGGALLGSCDDVDGRSEVFVWTERAGLTDLGRLDAYTRYFPVAVSAGGNVVLGTARADSGGGEAFRWTRGGGMQGLGVSAALVRGDAKAAMSKDGGVLLLASTSAGRARAYRWTEALGLLELESLPGHSGVDVRAVSEDGTLIGGASFLGDRAVGIEEELAVVWRDPGEPSSLVAELEAHGIEVRGLVPSFAVALPAGNGVYGEGRAANGRFGYIAGLARRP